MTEPFVEVITEQTLQRRVAEMGAQITADYPEGDLVVIAILKGSLFFYKDLLAHLPLTSTAEFLSLTRFGREGRVSVAMDVSIPLDDRDVLVVLEIVDTGLTLATIQRLIEAHGARSVRTATLLDKAPRRIVDVPIDYRGFEVGDEYLLGYGLDWEGYYRNVPSIWAVLDIPHLAENPRSFDSVAYRSTGIGA
ncbi:MAG: hypoxanthine phosphoribosyltransferase [Acidimicrobiia bacterium]|nr:MAG: hypoxanthine phosphoribosyltransferase [Acidimicrobiia bacterium]